MAKIFKFEDFIDPEVAEENDEFMSAEEIEELEHRLEKEYGHIKLSEEESDNMYANIMRQIMRLENIKNNKKK